MGLQEQEAAGTIHIGSQDGSVRMELLELVEADAEDRSPRDLVFSIRAACGQFSGHAHRVFIQRPDFERFLVELRDLESRRQGSARLAGMSEDEFRIKIRSTDALGHMAAEGVVGEVTPLKKEEFFSRIGFFLRIDPTALPEIVREFEDLKRSARFR